MPVGFLTVDTRLWLTIMAGQVVSDGG